MKYPGLVGSGTLGSVVTQKGRYGYFQRQRVKPRNPQSPSQIYVRDLQRQATRAWSTELTGPQRLAWNAWAAANPIAGKDGTSIALTGHAAYVSASRLQSSAGLDTADIANPPSGATALAVGAPIVWTPTFTSSDGGAPAGGLGFEGTNLTVGSTLVFRATPLLTDGQTAVSKKGMRQIAAVVVPAIVAPATAPELPDLFDAYEAVFGKLPENPDAAGHALFDILRIEAGRILYQTRLDVPFTNP